MLDLILNKVIEGWRNDKARLFPPNNRAEVVSAFEKINRKCSADVIELYCATGGMDEDSRDDKLFTLWSLNKIVLENTAFKGESVLDVAFGDYFIESHLYYFRYENENTSSVYTDGSKDGKIIKIADSVSEFFYIYLTDSKEIGLF
ncbi:MAG: hypothetical protein H7Z37_01285 [Pyrinomonadaceae bacterium]|nr:hypothetical protein [Pyrinomonadaceae bacterium]